MSLAKIIKEGVKLLLGYSFVRRRISLHKTFLFNAMAFGWRGIFKLPVYIYTGTKIYNVGKIHVTVPLKRIMIRLGGLDEKSQGVTKFMNYGTITFNGPTHICGCTIIENMGYITLGEYTRISDGCTLIIREKLTIGNYSRIGFQCFIMDSDDHYSIDIINNTSNRNSCPIYIGNYNWIGNNTYVKKGCHTPDYLIVASANALLLKDYTDLPPYSVIGGTPVKLLKSNLRRIYNLDQESFLNQYFKEHPEMDYYKYRDFETDNLYKQQNTNF